MPRLGRPLHLVGESHVAEASVAELHLAESDADHATEEFLFHAYKQLQFFDTLSLYFHMKPEGERGEGEFLNVPRSPGDDVTITAKELGGGRYEIAPYPFASDELTVSTEGRYLAPSDEPDMAALMAATDISTQTVTLCAAS